MARSPAEPLPNAAPSTIPDIFEDAEYEYWEAQRLGGFRSMLSVPMLLDDDVVGVVSVWRSELAPFDDAEIELVSVFADQASLAFETSRLMATVERQRGELAHYLPRQVADLLSSWDGEQLLAGHRRDITVVFCDLRGFTAFASKAEPEEVIGVLASFHEHMGRLIVEHGGTLSDFAGDGMMVYFNDPEPMDNHIDRQRLWQSSLPHPQSSRLTPKRGGTLSSLSGDASPSKRRESRVFSSSISVTLSQKGERHIERRCEDMGVNRSSVLSTLGNGWETMGGGPVGAGNGCSRVLV